MTTITKSKKVQLTTTLVIVESLAKCKKIEEYLDTPEERARLLMPLYDESSYDVKEIKNLYTFQKHKV